ncbi:CoA transferase [Kineosporia sp. NBRC 101677]|uniref:CoA transferase n=1 Tax=Kineosporia sp. NBRC 101677 TaxID=3032197 RepID=UPI002552738B|nr:CoA transferase [Kineosporia sp. NBRC 101677]
MTSDDAAHGQHLDGLRVVEVASFVAGPLATLSLAQLGAEVVRIDPLGGAADQTRWPLAPGGRSLYWAGLNQQKRSVALNLRSPEGRELALALATAPGEQAGIVVTNAVRGEWISYRAMAALRPDLIHARLLGLPDGSPAVDYTVNAAIGFPRITGPGPGPVNHVLPAWDLLAGMNLALAVLVAERTRRATGAGESIELSLYDVALSVSAHLGYLAEAALDPAGRPPGGNHYFGGFGRDFETTDGRVMVVLPSHRQWLAFVDVLGVADRLTALEKITGADLSTDSGRHEQREAIARNVAPWFAARTSAQVLGELSAAGVVASEYRRFTDVVADQGLLGVGNPVVEFVEEPSIGRIPAAGTPIRWGSRERAAVGSSQLLGADTGPVLSELLGLGQAELGGLAERGVIEL